MVKVGIIGADKPDAGELLRLLINHPEVEVESLYAPSLSGRQVTSCHHGFIGERTLTFSDRMNVDKLNMVFVADDSEFGRNVISEAHNLEDLRVIDLSPSRFDHWDNCDMEYGLSEINRKPLVRGARMAVVPSSVASLALIPLFPLAMHLLLPDEIDILVHAPADKSKEINVESAANEITRQLKSAQNSFTGHVNIKVVPDSSARSMRVTILMRCPLAVAEINNIYDSIYDDHNFAFTSISRVGDEEVEGTQKCVVSFCKPGAGLVEIESLGDCRLRGGAGDAVHVMNLLFALHEKVGLNLKPSSFGIHDDNDSGRASWFA